MNIAYGHDKYTELHTVFASVKFFVDEGLTLGITLSPKAQGRGIQDNQSS
jgi:hypothetical protein